MRLYPRQFLKKIDPIIIHIQKTRQSRKYVHDPLTSITKQLATRQCLPHLRPLPPKINLQKYKGLVYLASPQSEVHSNSYGGNESNVTPSTVFSDSGYGDIYNKREVREAHRFGDRYWDRGHRRWDDDDRNMEPPFKIVVTSHSELVDAFPVAQHARHPAIHITAFQI